MLVEYSDGAGRTGTYCLIDLVLQRITIQGNIKQVDVAASVEHLRDYRPDMIKAKVYHFNSLYDNITL